MKLDATVVGKALDLAYDKAVEGVPGVPGMDSAEGVAEDYLNDSKPLEDQVDALIRYQVLKASTSGFVTGLGGVLTLPVTVPVNFASVMYLQLQMVAAIARGICRLRLKRQAPGLALLAAYQRSAGRARHVGGLEQMNFVCAK